MVWAITCVIITNLKQMKKGLAFIKTNILNFRQ